MYDLERNTSSHANLASRKISVVSTASVKAGEDALLDGKEFKNAFVGFSITHDYINSARTSAAGNATISFGDDNTTLLKFNYSGIGNKCLAIQTSGTSLTTEGGASSSIPFKDFKISVRSYSQDALSALKVVAVAATYQATSPEADRPSPDRPARSEPGRSVHQAPNPLPAPSESRQACGREQDLELPRNIRE